MDPAPLLAIRL